MENTTLSDLAPELPSIFNAMESKQCPGLNTYYQSDVIYGKVEISFCTKLFIEHPIFTRMRNIKQLGALPYIFKHASHSRYEHSIGVAYLSRCMALYLRQRYPEITERMVLMVELAGLCHDIGHGPFSHAFDGLLKKVNHDEKTSHHEARSQLLFKYMAEELRIREPSYVDLTPQEIKLVMYFIDPASYKKHFDDVKHDNSACQDPTVYPNLMPFYKGLEQIVNNYIHKFDTDKIDYLLRDSFYLRLDISLHGDFNIMGMIRDVAIDDNVLMYNIRDSSIIYTMICRRLVLYQESYTCPKSMSINAMLTDALEMADSVWKFTSYSNLEDAKCIDNFCKLTDDFIIISILNTPDSRFSTAKDLINRILSQKNLYEYDGDYAEINDENKAMKTVIPRRIYGDASIPTASIPSVIYHQNGNRISQGNKPASYSVFNKRLPLM